MMIIRKFKETDCSSTFEGCLFVVKNYSEPSSVFSLEFVWSSTIGSDGMVNRKPENLPRMNLNNLC